MEIKGTIFLRTQRCQVLQTYVDSEHLSYGNIRYVVK